MKPVVTLRPTMSIAQARDTLLSHRISGAPVVGTEGELLGVFSQSDFLRAAFSSEVGDSLEEGVFFSALQVGSTKAQVMNERLSKIQVSSAMSDSLVTASPDDSLSRIAHLMRQNHVHRVLITEHGKLIGIISAFDLLAVLEEYS